MANNCYIQIDIQLNNIFDKDRVFDYFHKIFHNAHLKDEGAYIGSESRYLFDAEINDVDDCEIEIVGWVKWGIQDNEMISFFKYLNEICFIQKLSVSLLEIGNGVCEKYTYDCNNEDIIIHDVLSYETMNDIVQYNNEDFDTIYQTSFDKLTKESQKYEIEIN